MKIGGKKEAAEQIVSAGSSTSVAGGVSSAVSVASSSTVKGGSSVGVEASKVGKVVGEEKIITQLTVSQFLDKKESLRDRIVTEAKRFELFLVVVIYVCNMQYIT